MIELYTWDYFLNWNRKYGIKFRYENGHIRGKLDYFNNGVYIRYDFYPYVDFLKIEWCEVRIPLYYSDYSEMKYHQIVDLIDSTYKEKIYNLDI